MGGLRSFLGTNPKTTTTNTQTQSQYQANPLTADLASWQSGQLRGLPGPGGVPLRGIQGFNPYQTGAMAGLYNLGEHNPADPYFQKAQGLVEKGSSPLDMDAVGKLYKGMADPYFASMNNLFGQQQSQNNGNQVQAAGGVGASRIAVGQGELAKQQTLAQGQLGSGLMGQSLGAYQQEKQNQLAGGSLMGALGQGALGTQLQGWGAALGAGNQMQGLGQAQMDALYAQQQGQYQNPYQNLAAGNQTLGAFSGALGGNQTGSNNQQKTVPGGSPFGAIAGLAGTALGAYFGMPGLGGSIGSAMGGKGSRASQGDAGQYGGSYQPSWGTGGMMIPSMGGYSPSNPYTAAAGGRINPYSFGEGYEGGGGAYDEPPDPDAPAPDGDEPPPTEAYAALPQAAGAQQQRPGLPALPDLPSQPGPAAQRVSNPWLALMQAGLSTMSAAGRRDSHGLLTSPAGAIGEGGMAGIKTLETQRAQEREDQKVQRDAELSLYNAKMQQLPYSQMTEAQRATAAQAARPYQEQTADQIAKNKIEREKLERGRWSYLGPNADGTKSVFLDAVSGETEERDVKVGAKPQSRPIPPTLQKDLGDKATSAQQLGAIVAALKPSYGGDVSSSYGDMKNWIARQAGLGDKERASWWQDYEAYKAKVRHSLYGAALTGYEIAQWQRQDINPGMQPDVIERNLKRQQSIINGALQRRAQSLMEQGYSKPAIEAELGFKIGDKQSVPSGKHPEQDRLIQEAKKALGAGANRDAVIKRLKDNGIEIPEGF